MSFILVEQNISFGTPRLWGTEDVGTPILDKVKLKAMSLIVSNTVHTMVLVKQKVWNSAQKSWTWENDW